MQRSLNVKNTLQYYLNKTLLSSYPNFMTVVKSEAVINIYLYIFGLWVMKVIAKVIANMSHCLC